VCVTLPLYVGWFLWPFGGAMLTATIPNVADDLETSLTLVGAAITAYMIPFAVLHRRPARLSAKALLGFVPSLHVLPRVPRCRSGT
jgi:hypothetical protein